jgi:probable phosphoglycerate mutase
MTRVVAIQAAPTPWDEEERLVGNHTLPLTEAAQESIRQTIARIDFPVHAVYRCAANEATNQAGRLAAQQFHLRARDAAGLEEMSVGLWKGLTRNDLRARFPSAFPRWEQNAMAVNPPEGESLTDAIERLRQALRKILRKHRDETVLLALRPMSMHIILGILRLQTPQQIGADLHNTRPVETIDISEQDLHRYID